jgi:histidine ammonia-lyase
LIPGELTTTRCSQQKTFKKPDAIIMQNKSLTINGEHINPEAVYRAVKSGAQIELGDESIRKIKRCREFLEETTQKGGIHYGINTGFGHLCDVVIQDDKLEQLQENLLLSHACGTGDIIPDDISRTMLILKIKNLSLGNSGVRTELVNQLKDMYNTGAAPMVYEQGSLGASGDLAPLAHLCLPLVGEGKLKWRGKMVSASEFLKANNWEPMTLASKEGLALINGTQFSCAFGIHSTVRGKLLLELANLCAALSLEAFNCHTGPFNPNIHKIRPTRVSKKSLPAYWNGCAVRISKRGRNSTCRTHTHSDVFRRYMERAWTI